VKDARHHDEAASARKELDGKAAGVIQDVGNKIAEKVKLYDYDSAIALALGNYAVNRPVPFATDGYIAIPRYARGGIGRDDDDKYQSRRM
jgi:hypothetical protein